MKELTLFVVILLFSIMLLFWFRNKESFQPVCDLSTSNRTNPILSPSKFSNWIIPSTNGTLTSWRNLPWTVWQSKNKDFAVSFWIFVTRNNLPEEVTLFSVETRPGIFLTSTGALSIRMKVQGNEQGLDRTTESTLYAIPKLRSVFIIVSFNSTGYTLWIDGDHVNDFPTSTQALTSAYDDLTDPSFITAMYVSIVPNSTEKYCCVKDIRIYREALIPSDALCIYQKNVSNADLVGAKKALGLVSTVEMSGFTTMSPSFVRPSLVQNFVQGFSRLVGSPLKEGFSVRPQGWNRIRITIDPSKASAVNNETAIQISQIAVKDPKGYKVDCTYKGSSITWQNVHGEPNQKTDNSWYHVPVDGNEFPRPYPYVFHSMGPLDAYYEIEFEKWTEVGSITIYNRDDCCQYRLACCILTLYDDFDTNTNIKDKQLSVPLDASLVQTFLLSAGELKRKDPVVSTDNKTETQIADDIKSQGYRPLTGTMMPIGTMNTAKVTLPSIFDDGQVRSLTAVTFLQDKENYINFPDAVLDEKGITFCVWFYATDKNMRWNRIFDFGNGPADNNVVCAFLNNSLQFYVFRSTTYTAVNWEMNIVANTWYHLAWTLDPINGWVIYINGIPKKFPGKLYPQTTDPAKQIDSKVTIPYIGAITGREKKIRVGLGKNNTPTKLTNTTNMKIQEMDIPDDLQVTTYNKKYFRNSETEYVGYNQDPELENIKSMYISAAQALPTKMIRPFSYIGKSNWWVYGYDEHFDGRLGDFRIYNRVMSDNEIRYIFNHPE